MRACLNVEALETRTTPSTLALDIAPAPPDDEAVAAPTALLLGGGPLLLALEGPTAAERVAALQQYAQQRAHELAALEGQLSDARAERFAATLRGQDGAAPRLRVTIARLEARTERANDDLLALNAILTRLPPTTGVAAVTVEEVAAWLPGFAADKEKEAKALTQEARASRQGLGPRPTLAARVAHERLVGRALEAEYFAAGLARITNP